jgi:hypothetical protein|tara:strand:- start:263 stop:1048 length:786 start_codon:yes stop_codon:yes gene_type:complete
MSSLLDDVNQLLNQNKGDSGRLQHIKDTLEKNKTLYVSDRQYITTLMKNLQHPDDSPKSYSTRIPSSQITDNDLYSDNENVARNTNSNSSQNNFNSPPNTSSTGQFCGKCGHQIPHNNGFCGKCGYSQNTQTENQHNMSNPPQTDSGIKSFQVLSIIGGVLGLLVTLLYALTASIVDNLATSFGGKGFDAEFSALLSVAMPLTLIIYISCFIVPFVIKKTKIVGIYLIISAFVVVIASSYVGIIGFALILPAGILALRQKR